MAWERPFIAVYLMTNRPFGTLYVGVTSSLIRRVREHRTGTVDGFTKRYGLHRLVWFRPYESIAYAIRKEKLIKGYPRDWKINLVNRENPDWLDLFPVIAPEPVWRHDPPASEVKS